MGKYEKVDRPEPRKFTLNKPTTSQIQIEKRADKRRRRLSPPTTLVNFKVLGGVKRSRRTAFKVGRPDWI
jgi:hypothetical protein